MRLSPTQYTLAENIGLSLWVERRSLFRINSPRVFAPLGIVLSQELNGETELKVFRGMLSVLSLEASDYWLGWFQPQADITAEQLKVELQKWHPQAVLLMGASFRKREDGHSLVDKAGQFVATYHPRALIENPDLKKEAYQDLLKLKENLSLIRTC